MASFIYGRKADLPMHKIMEGYNLMLEFKITITHGELMSVRGVQAICEAEAIILALLRVHNLGRVTRIDVEQLR